MKVLALALATALLVSANTCAFAQQKAQVQQLDRETDRYTYDSTVQLPSDLGTMGVLAELTNEDIARATATPIHAVGAYRNASPTLFANPKTFRRMVQASLECRSNTAHLVQLAHNYPNLEVLTVRQQTPLTQDDLSLIRSFSRLQFLEIACPVREPSSVGEYLPPTLQALVIDGSNIIESEQLVGANLPYLAELCIRNCSFTAGIFGKLNCPKLEFIEVANSRVLGDTLGRVHRFPSLQRVDIYQTQMATAVLDELKDLPDLRISKMTSSNLYGADTCWAEGLLEKR